MLMPIVSMNKMAMNESVAATCCYREVASPTNVYWEVLNGGWIGSGYVMDLAWIKTSYKGWAQLGYDVVPSAGTSDANRVDMPALTKTTLPSGDVQWIVGGTTELHAFFAGGAFKVGDACSHGDGLCYYKTEDPIYKTNQHFDAKTKHTTGGSNWNKPHSAGQYNS